MELMQASPHQHQQQWNVDESERLRLESEMEKGKRGSEGKTACAGFKSPVLSMSSSPLYPSQRVSHVVRFSI